MLNDINWLLIVEQTKVILSPKLEDNNEPPVPDVVPTLPINTCWLALCEIVTVDVPRLTICIIWPIVAIDGSKYDTGDELVMK